MSDLTTTKVFAGLTTIATTDLDAIIPQASLAVTAISSKPAAGATVDADSFLVLKSVAGTLQQMTALQFKTYLAQVFVPSAISVQLGVTITTAGENTTAWTQQLTNVTFNTIAGRVAMGWLNLACIPLAAATAIKIDIFRGAGVSAIGSFQFQFPSGSLTAPNSWPISLQVADPSTLGGSNTYYALAQGIGGSVLCSVISFSMVQI